MLYQETVPNAYGRATLWTVTKRGLWVPRGQTDNLVLYSWGHIAARQIGYGRDVNRYDYSLRGMYIEFENVASPGDPVATPAFGRGDGLEYYDDLSGSASKDFLRVGLRGQPELAIEDGFSSHFEDGESGNKLNIFAQTVGTVGVHGKTFSDSVNSKVFGAALIARPVLDDRTQDVLFSRAYFTTAEQTVKEASEQIGVSWEISFI